MSVTIFKTLITISIVLLSFGVKTQAQNANVTVNQDEKIAKLLDVKKQINKKNYNFTIQIFKGNVDKASATLTVYQKLFTQWRATIEYGNPDRKIWAGKFLTRLNAERALIKIKKQFNDAFIVPLR